MALLASLVGLALAATVFNIVLTFGVVKRLREHASLLSERRSPDADVSDIVIGPGAVPAEFSATAVDGTTVDNGLLDSSGHAVVAFFSVSCSACEEAMPEMLDFAAARASEQLPMVAVVVGGESESDPYVSKLRSVTTVVREDPDGPMAAAFGVRGFPVFCSLAEGRVASIGFRPGRLTL